MSDNDSFELCLNASVSDLYDISNASSENILVLSHSLSRENDRSIGVTYETCPAAPVQKDPSVSEQTTTISEDFEAISLLEDEQLPGLSTVLEVDVSLPETNVKASVPGESKNQRSSLTNKRFISKSQESLGPIVRSSKLDYSHVPSKVKQYIDNMNAKDQRPVAGSSRFQNESKTQHQKLDLNLQEKQLLLQELREAKSTIRIQQEEICRLLLKYSKLENTVDDLKHKLAFQSAKNQERSTAISKEVRYFRSRAASLSSLGSSEASAEAAKFIEDLSPVARVLGNVKDRKPTPYIKRSSLQIAANLNETLNLENPSCDTDTDSTSYKTLPQKPGTEKPVGNRQCNEDRGLITSKRDAAMQVDPLHSEHHPKGTLNLKGKKAVLKNQTRE